MKKIITHSIVFMLVLLSLDTFAQEARDITGKVTAKDNGQPVPGVTVLVKGTTLGAATDLEGNYVLKSVPPDAKTLVFSAVGLKKREVDIGASNTVDLVMESDALKLDEVVVTAIGISREKKALGYSTQSVGAEDLNQSGTGNALNE